MQEMERAAAFREEIVLWIIVAVCLILFISNFGIGGAVGNAISGFLFGVFGVIAYVFPVIFLIGSFFAVSNRGNMSAVVKIVAAVLFALFLCLFCSLLAEKTDVLKPAEAFSYSREKKTGGGICGGTLAYLLVPAFGRIGAYIIDIIVLIISLVLFTGKSVMKWMQSGGQKAYESAKESSERRQEYREYRAKEREKLRSEKKVSGVSVDTKIDDEVHEENSDRMSELHADRILEEPEVVEKQTITLPPESSLPKVEEPEPVQEEAPSVIPMISGNFSREAGEIVSFDRASNKAETLHTMEATRLTGFSETDNSAQEPEISGSVIPFEEKAAQISEPTPVVEMQPEPAQQEIPAKKKKPSAEEIEQGVNEVTEEMDKNDKPVQHYVFPSVDLLKKAPAGKGGNSERDLRETAAKLEQTLKTFGVNVTVTNISCGPAVTRYEVQPEMGVKVSKIVGLADDIKLNLAAADIRIEAPIPGKAAVGIEVPNKENVMVSFRELIEDAEFLNAKSKITFAVGRDIAGKVKVADIGKMPHLLIAGATGSGKSVCINTIIMSILYKADPNDVKLILIDPKVVELSVYNGIPHLMIPVVTDPKKAAGALNWAVQEMTHRYELFAEAGVRDLAGYNAKVDAITAPDGPEKPKRLPQIVIIVDELADLMMVASGDVEEAICRLAQLARACGIHLVIATQRPSVNVITGLIKANMPSRIAFAVTSGVDSRTILDMIGAEKLLGKGDMLFYPQGIPKPLRVQGAFVSDKEVSDVVDFLKSNNGAVTYSEDVQKKVESLQSSGNQTVSISDSDTGSDGRDSYFYEAAKIIIDKDKASIGMLQRYLKVGFNRAARIMDQMEEAGIVGPEEGTKPRKVLMTQEELAAQFEE
jgi:S-DNA-T family DNA segregation ATPase FtsK/SpoIIIE